MHLLDSYSADVRETIIAEIRRIAAANGGKPPGKSAFQTHTGISESKWAGVYWSKWSDALADAGFAPNQWRQRLDTYELVKRFASVTLTVGHVPTIRELKLLRRTDPSIPSPGIIKEHFGDRDGVIVALKELSLRGDEYASLQRLLPEIRRNNQRRNVQPNVVERDGFVYLIKWEQRYKIGRSDDPNRALREIRAQLPTPAAIIHTIQTDDPVGIEAYWHQRFADRRLRGEWFDLSAADVKAFQRRKFQ